MTDTAVNAEVQVLEELKPLSVGGEIQALIPRTYDEARSMALGFCHAGIIPKGLTGKNDDETLGMVTTAIMQGLEVGFGPVAAISNIMVVNGRPSIWGDGLIALIQASRQVEYFKEWIEGDALTDDWTAYTEIKRKGQEEPYKGSFSWKQAQKARLTGKAGPWLSYPDRMLQVRARSWAVRDGFADVLKGLSVVEEVQDLPKEKEEVETDFLDE